MENKKKTIFIVEHMEPFLFTWCKHQYLQMLIYLQNQSIPLYFTNAKSFLNYEGQQSAQNKSNIQQLMNGYSIYKNSGGFIKQSLSQNLKNNQGNLHIPQLGIYLPNQICLLDMRATKELVSNDKNQLYVYVFGGILGDHPPRDRTKALRQHCVILRHIGSLQLSTDTAVLTTKLIINNNLNLKDIPFVKQPEIIGPNKQNLKTVIQMEGFSYISAKLNWKNGQIQKKSVSSKQILMNPNIRKLLLEQELDVALFI